MRVTLTGATGLIGPRLVRELLSRGDEVTVLTRDPAKARTAYLRELTGLTLQYDRELRGAGIDYVQLDTSQPLDFALLTYLSARSKRK